MIALFAALQIEVQRFLRHLEAVERLQVDGFPVTVGDLAGRQLLVCRAGLGRRAAEAAATVLARYRPEAVLSVGLAGALSPECAVGELVLCERVYRADPEAEGGRAAEPVLSDPRLLEAARRATDSLGLSNRTGSALTTAHLVAEPHRKATLRQVTGLDVVEMESYWVGRAALELGVPFLAVRVVFDGAGDAVPEIPGLISPQGEQRARHVLPYILRRPTRIARLIGMAGAKGKALSNLTRFLEAFVSVSEPSLAGRPAR